MYYVALASARSHYLKHPVNDFLVSLLLCKTIEVGGTANQFQNYHNIFEAHGKPAAFAQPCRGRGSIIKIF